MTDQITNAKDIPGDIDLLRPWFNIIRDARSAGISNGLSLLPITVVVDEHGMPIQWCKVDPVKLSPLSQRDQFELLIKTLAGDKSIPGNTVDAKDDTTTKRGVKKSPGK
jgi:hypothetical protein